MNLILNYRPVIEDQLGYLVGNGSLQARCPHRAFWAPKAPVERTAVSKIQPYLSMVRRFIRKRRVGGDGPLGDRSLPRSWIGTRGPLGDRSLPRIGLGGSSGYIAGSCCKLGLTQAFPR